MSYPTKADLYSRGIDMLLAFCELNDLNDPAVAVKSVPIGDWHFDVCGYYRRNTIHICVPKCAAIGVAGPAWSYPGNTVDRTPYGVLAHELGHHIDVLNSQTKGAYFGDFSERMRETTGEEKLTSYCPNDAEWFAEMFRLFVTNPGLLRILRPRTYIAIATRYKPLFADDWKTRLADAPERTIKAVERRVSEAAMEHAV